MDAAKVIFNTARPSGLAFVKYRGVIEAVQSSSVQHAHPFALVHPHRLPPRHITRITAEAAQSGGVPAKIANAGSATILAALPNWALNRSANGMSPGPVRGAQHSPQPGPGAIPSSPG